MICAIHQPNFFPWIGFFDKIHKSDIFVIMDYVERPTTGSSWFNRVNINIQNTSNFFSVPIMRSENRIIKDVITKNHIWRKKFLKTLEHSYSKSYNYKNTIKILKPLIEIEELNLCEYNIYVIKEVCKLFNIKTPIVRQSNLDTKKSATELLIEITKSVNCDSYMCGGGASGYQQDELFSKNNIKLVYQDFTPKPYGNITQFIPGLSIIDYMMHENYHHLYYEK